MKLGLVHRPQLAHLTKLQKFCQKTQQTKLEGYADNFCIEGLA